MFRTICVALCFLASTLSAFAQQSRHFTFHYAFTVKNLPAGKKVRIWIPAAHSDAYQEVKVISAKGDLRLKKTREPKFGNEIYFAETKTSPAELHFDIEYDILRKERLGFNSIPHLIPASLPEKEREEDLQPDALVPTTGIPADLAIKVTQGITDRLDKARAIYDYVFTTLKYDKTGTGWGAATYFTLATRRRAIAPISTRSSLRWLDHRAFRRALKSDFLCRPTSIPRRSPAITAGPIFSSMARDGFRSIFPRHGSIRRSAITSLDRMT
jgi:hypothetical protein